MSKQLVMKDRLVTAGRAQNTENFISGVLMLSLSHLHTKLVSTQFFTNSLRSEIRQTELVMLGVNTLRAARKTQSSSVLLT